MERANLMLGLRAMAPVHVGGEDVNGVVDLAIQREKHSQWPVVFASSVKGALRENLKSRWADGSLESALFGPSRREGQEMDNQSARAGALLVGEMRLLALPVPSLSSVFKWITCPHALQRLQRDAHMYGITLPAFAIPSCAGDLAYSMWADDPEHIFLREYAFRKQMLESDGLARLFAHLFAAQGQDDAEEFAQRLLLVSDQRFGYLAQTATAISPHIALDENKITVDGALWYEENLPSETLMYLPLALENERRSAKQQADEVNARSKTALLHELHSVLLTPPYLRMGANETTGMGWFALRAVSSQRGEAA